MKENKRFRVLGSLIAFITIVIFCIIITFNINKELGKILSLIGKIVYVPVIYWAINDNVIMLKKANIGLKMEVRKIVKEIIKFSYIMLGIIIINAIYINIIGLPENQQSINETMALKPIVSRIVIVIIAPILEECIFRYLPYQFIKNKNAYILFTSIIFAALHVISTPNAILYIPMYLPFSLYMGYKYYKTKDIFITMSLHSYSNFIATL